MADTARVLSGYVDAVMIRTDHHAKAAELAEYASVPVINGLTDASHPCQLLADMQAVIERLGRLAGTRWAWLGDGNNVCHSLIEAGSLMGFEVRVACPPGHEPDADVLTAAGAHGGLSVPILRDPRDAVADADVVVTDTWTSMGQLDDGDRLAALHSLPGRRGADGGGPAGCRFSSIACPRIAAKK